MKFRFESLGLSQHCIVSSLSCSSLEFFIVFFSFFFFFFLNDYVKFSAKKALLRMQLAGMFFGDFQFQMVGFIFLFNSVKVQCYYSFEY